MLGFIYSNQSIIIFLGFLLLVIMFYIVAKKLSTKVEKKNKQEEKKEDKQPISETEQVEDVEKLQPNGDVDKIEEPQESDDKLAKESKKPKIVQIYKRRERTSEPSSNSKQDNDPIYNRNVEFVNTSKNIAKFKSFVEETPKQSNAENVVKDEFGFVAEEQDDCDFCEVQVKHFDHKKRLSDVMTEESDLFASHISEKYLNINSDRHLNLNRIEGKLLERADKMIKNSEMKVKCEHEEHDGVCFHEDCLNDDDDEVEVNMKTALVAETYFNRKRKK